ncbi:MAG: 2-oxoacid:acceptor oxidoreductase subunit alpha [Aminivibrio sp.]|jgi:2-oxoglutarate ferredoxin oxidoreductase subunit alpha|nr:2-oxoacid:acceptor oxidoreductase subunit alpha [Synergistaceae bacterium]
MLFSSPAGRQDVCCVISGAAGLGIQTVEDMLARVIVDEGFCVFGSREYMSRVRGGNNSTELRVSSEPVDALIDRIDILIALSRNVRQNILERISPHTVILGDRDELKGELEDRGASFVHIPLSSLAKEAGGAIYSNSIAAGALLGVLGLGTEGAAAFYRDRFAGKDDVVTKNIAALEKGYGLGAPLGGEGGVLAGRPRSKGGKKTILNGSDAVALGAMAAGCNFVTAYPMSPATGVLSFFYRHAAEAGAVVEQTEDELAAINMAVGASYAGARPMVTTSGGGFALMAEGLSLAGVVEAPLVVHLAQRPGPATGMATRTEQADLELALHSGHGEFPRAVYAPGTMESAFRLTQEAFASALRFQTPAIVLTDQYFVNAFHNLDESALQWLEEPSLLPETGGDYRRYEDAPDGCSPMGVPGWGKGIVGADSHEHDEVGHVYEDFHLRTRMQDKRMRKLDGLTARAVPPRLFGPGNYRNLVVCWGSTLPILREALAGLDRDDTALLAFEQVWPLAPSSAAMLEKASFIAVAEGNSTGQFARLLRAEFGVKADKKILKYNGLQFSVEEASAMLAGALPAKGGDR